MKITVINTYGFNSLKHTGKATVILPFWNAPSATLISSSAEVSVHVDLYASKAFSISLQGDLFVLSLFLSLSHSFFLSFSSFFFHFLERRRSWSQVIIKIRAQQMQQTALQTKYQSSNFSDKFTHSSHNCNDNRAPTLMVWLEWGLYPWSG